MQYKRRKICLTRQPGVMSVGPLEKEIEPQHSNCAVSNMYVAIIILMSFTSFGS